MNPFREHDLSLTRRQLFGRGALGLGTAALHQLFSSQASAASLSGSSSYLHHAPKAKRVIYLFMSGGPSQHDMWDFKPKMRDYFGEDLPEEVRDGQRITGMTAGQATLPVCPSKYAFKKYDNNDQGVWISELLPHTATVAKELCVVHSAYTEAINHDPAVTYIQSGSQIGTRTGQVWLDGNCRAIIIFGTVRIPQ